MVCVSCIFIPIFIWIWFEFVMPILLKLKSLVFGTKVEPVTKAAETEKKDLKCPFGKSVTDTTDETKTCPFGKLNEAVPNEIKKEN